MLPPVTQAESIPGSTEPIVENATLEWRNHQLHPTRILSSLVSEHRTGAQLLILSNATVTALDSTTRSLKWTATGSPATVNLRWLAAEDSVAYLDSSSAIKRLDLRSGKWLPDLTPHGSNEKDVVKSVLARKDCVIVLTTAAAGSGNSYRVTCFGVLDGQPFWTKSFHANVEYGPPSALLLSAWGPDQAVPAIKHLSWLGGNVLVCAGPRQDIICLDGITGKTNWTIERVWEFDRSFIGPSVWSHFITRFGQDSFIDDNKPVDATTIKKFDSLWNCRIIGGPIVVAGKPSPDSRTEAEASIFIAVARASNEGARSIWASYLGECIVYEFDQLGHPLSLTTLPRLVTGSETHTEPGVLVWNCQKNSMVRLQAFNPGKLMEGPFEGSDLLTKISWYREFDVDEPNSWLSVPKVGDPAAFGASQCFRILNDGYVKYEADQIFNLPMSAIGYADGSVEPLLLKVPLTGIVPPPKSNYRRLGRSYHSMVPYFLGITHLKLEDDQLVITLSMEKRSTTLIFNLAEVKR